MLWAWLAVMVQAAPAYEVAPVPHCDQRERGVARSPRRHAWGEIVKGEGVRLGDDRISVLTRRCSTCEAREDRYLKVTTPS